MLIFRQKKFWLLPVLILVLLAADALFLGRDGAIHLGGAGEPFPSFRTETLDGRAVTDEIFAGKTTAVCAILQALANRGGEVGAFKCGPDYIDPMFH